MNQQQFYAIREKSQVGEARRRVGELTEQLHFDSTTREQVAIVVSELATNLLKHAGGGEIVVRSLAAGETPGGGVGIELLALDRGPGMANVAPLPATQLLLVEDQAEMRYLFQKLLAGTAYQLVEAATGHEGLRQARMIHPQVICLDLMLPGLDGFTVLEQLKADPATSAIPIVIVTAKTLTPAEEERLVPCATLLSKADLSQAALLAAIRRAQEMTR